MSTPTPPILDNKETDSPSVFRPENLLREGRRQRGAAEGRTPPLCVLDPDGDILRYLDAKRAIWPWPSWACYHTTLYGFDVGGATAGIVGCAVGAPFAVLLAEQMFASGCRLLLHITSAGRLAPIAEPPYFVLVERALRDEGTSYHYLPPAAFAEADAALLGRLEPALRQAGPKVVRGATWTTDAPYRETETVIRRGTEMGLAAIEMECAALYAFARARGRPVACLAHVTNTMAVSAGDFEKGAEAGALDALALIRAVAARQAPFLSAEERGTDA